MKNIILAVIFALQLSESLSQYFIIYADTVNFEESCNYLFIETSATNLWQMGIPGKTILDSAYSAPYTIITDTVNYYPTNNHSSFVIKLDSAIFSWISCIDVHFWHKFDTDSLTDYGVVEVSYDEGIEWNVLRTDTTYDNFVFFYRNGSWTATHLATGQSNGWLMDTYTFNSYLTSAERPDNIWLRFSFYSDSIQDDREGWMIDDIIILGIEPWGIKENVLFNSYPYPNPCQQKLYIATPECGNFNFTLYIYDNLGKTIVTKSFDNESIQINLDPYPAGLYFYKITDNGTREISNGKFIIKK